MKNRWLAGLAFLGGCAAAAAQDPILHRDLQAVTPSGTTAWAGSVPFTIRGVLLNDPAEMLDPTYDPTATAMNYTGGIFQVFFQAVDADDRGGTALWMAQNYNALGGWVPPGNDYGADWTNEMIRVTRDANGRLFRKGDQIEVTARKALFYDGKVNVNENHRIVASNDFDVVLVKPNAGLPQAEAITLADLVTAGTNQIFDSSRATGGEHWQGMRVRLDGIRLTDTNGWGKAAWAERTCLAADAAGRSFPLRMPRTDLGDPPAPGEYFSAVGILNQEKGRTNGYELFVQEIQPEVGIELVSPNGRTLSFPADYEGYAVEYSDDGLATWTNLDAMPRKMIVVEDADPATNRMYRLRKID